MQVRADKCFHCGAKVASVTRTSQHDQHRRRKKDKRVLLGLQCALDRKTVSSDARTSWKTRLVKLTKRTKVTLKLLALL